MGLAASQARFLCITSRKADCEYKSTELAQQKLEITNQLSSISTEYSNAMNATKLMWSNEAVEGDYGLTYSLLMMPSAANDYNPYMITTPSGAVVLNSEYAAAAKAAGISKAGGVGSQESRDKFIQALVPGGLITQETANAITETDFLAVKNSDNTISFSSTIKSDSNSILWDPSAGMGRNPLDKSSADTMTLADLILSESIGQQVVDWGQVIAGSGQVTKLEKDKEIARFTKLLETLSKEKIDKDIVNQLVRDRNNYKRNNSDKSDTTEYLNKLKEYDELIANAKKVMAGETSGGLLLDSDGNTTSVAVVDVIAAAKTQIAADKTAYESSVSGAVTVDPNDHFNIDGNSLNSGNKTFTVVQNGVINHYKDEINYMTIGDILSSDIVLMSNDGDVNKFAEQVTNLLENIASVFGYSSSQDLTGQGLNVDDASAKALEFAMLMTKRTYLNPDAAIDVGSRDSDKSMVENSAYQNAVENNRIGIDGDKKYCAVSLSNMLSSFLTYYENALSGSSSSYVVGDSVDTSVYVTDNAGYVYMAQSSTDAITSADGRSADFFDELYNNILEHGWREDAAIDDAEYLESAIKDGRYSMSSLNQDGYYYQTRYNETGYIVEVSDTDAIARAEAEFTSKKAELTYKEDSIDLKSKKLDAEISSLTTEYDTVKQLISKSIEKTFTLFSN